MEVSTSKPQVLYRHGALAEGSELWVCPEPKSSQWSQKLDWYMNFQLTKSRLSIASQLHTSLVEWTGEHEFSLDKKEKVQNEVLLFAGAGNLPCQQLVVHEYKGDPNSWSQKLIKVAQSLRARSIRIFLPDSLQSLEMTRVLSQIPESKKFKTTLVPGQGEHNRNL